jgi:hypothetical protein
LPDYHFEGYSSSAFHGEAVRSTTTLKGLNRKT